MQAYAITLLRLSLGTLALAHGLLKVFVFTVPGTVGYFESLGLPGFLAYPTILAEVGGACCLSWGYIPAGSAWHWSLFCLAPPGFTQAMGGCSPMKAEAGNFLSSGLWPYWFRQGSVEDAWSRADASPDPGFHAGHAP
ncbi:DoxX [Halomonas elongata]|uniref:DoxX n=1 Tax=Halomonas elongata TaxID=2746 RepID=A0A1B8NZS7_HALEL|nr:DoxX [Halomonas elongata]